MTKYIDAEPLKAKIKGLAEEITRLLEENKELKETKTEDIEHWCDVCTKQSIIEQARAEGQNEAWELAQKVYFLPEFGGYDSNELIEIFDTAFMGEILRYTYTEAAKKVAEWEKAKEEIKNGDVLEGIYDNTLKCTVTNHHIDIDSFLKQIGGEQE